MKKKKIYREKKSTKQNPPLPQTNQLISFVKIK